MARARMGGREMWYELRGHRAPLLLIHAFPLDHEMWRPQIETFAKVRRILAPDLMGFGSSDEHGRETLDQHADDLVALLDRLGFPQAVVCGLSMGGYIALALWRRHPTRVAAMVLADTRSGADSESTAADRRRLASRIRREGVGSLAEEMPSRLLSPYADPGAATELCEIIERQPKEGVASALEAMADRPDSTEDLPTIAAPTLILVGTNDDVTPLAESELIAQGIPDSKLVEVPRAGHLANFEEPGAFNAALRTFLETVDDSQGTS